MSNGIRPWHQILMLHKEAKPDELKLGRKRGQKFMNRRSFLTHFGLAAIASPLIPQIRARAASPPAPGAPAATPRPFISRLQPAVAGGGFELPDYWVWCGAPIRGEDGRYHLFASRVTKEVVFHPHWLFCSEIVRAESATPVGPYRLAEVALPPRGGDFFDARSTHNPPMKMAVCRR